MSQKWKSDPSLYGCDRKDGKKVLDYKETYVGEFLNSDPLIDWPSFNRCKSLWMWAQRMAKLSYKDVKEMSVLDCGAKDGQFPEWLLTVAKDAIGIEISDPYVKYCQERKRPVVYGDVCHLPDEWTERFDFVFSHHLLGLVEDPNKAVEEMFRVAKPGGFILTLTDIPGNQRKHYSLIEDDSMFRDFPHECKIVFNGRWNEMEYEKEWVFYIRKYGGLDAED